MAAGAGRYDGGQRTISRFRCQYRHMPADGQAREQSGPGTGADAGKLGATTWLATVARHWTLAQPNPRSGDREAYQ